MTAEEENTAMGYAVASRKAGLHAGGPANDSRRRRYCMRLCQCLKGCRHACRRSVNNDRGAGGTTACLVQWVPLPAGCRGATTCYVQGELMLVGCRGHNCLLGAVGAVYRYFYSIACE